MLCLSAFLRAIVKGFFSLGYKSKVMVFTLSLSVSGGLWAQSVTCLLCVNDISGNKVEPELLYCKAHNGDVVMNEIVLASADNGYKEQPFKLVSYNVKYPFPFTLGENVEIRMACVRKSVFNYEAYSDTAYNKQGFFKTDVSFFKRNIKDEEGMLCFLYEEKPILIPVSETMDVCFSESFLQYFNGSAKGMKANFQRLVLAFKGHAYSAIVFDDRCCFAGSNRLSILKENSKGLYDYCIDKGWYGKNDFHLEPWVVEESSTVVPSPTQLHADLESCSRSFFKPVLDVKRYYYPGEDFHYDWVGFSNYNAALVVKLVYENGEDLVSTGSYIRNPSQTKGLDINKTTRTITKEKLMPELSSDADCRLVCQDNDGVLVKSKSFTFLAKNSVASEVDASPAGKNAPVKNTAFFIKVKPFPSVPERSEIYDLEKAVQTLLLNQGVYNNSHCTRVGENKERSYLLYRVRKNNNDPNDYVRVDCSNPASPKILGKISEVKELQNILPVSFQSRYVLIKKIGKGFESNIYKALDISKGVFCAVRVVTNDACREKSEDEKAVNNYKMIKENEIVEIIKANPAKNIVNIRDVHYCPINKKLWVVMDYYKKTLEDVLGERSLSKIEGGLSKIEAMDYLHQLLSGLSCLHGLNIVHRDLKPKNILIDSDGHLNICDFGFSHKIEGEEIDSCQYLVGAPAYFSIPKELLKKEDSNLEVMSIFSSGYNGFQSDIFAAGMLYLKMRTDEIPQSLMKKKGAVPYVTPKNIPTLDVRLKYDAVIQFWRWMYGFNGGVQEGVRKYFELSGCDAEDDEIDHVSQFFFGQAPSFYRSNACEYIQKIIGGSK